MLARKRRRHVAMLELENFQKINKIEMKIFNENNNKHRKSTEQQAQTGIMEQVKQRVWRFRESLEKPIACNAEQCIREYERKSVYYVECWYLKAAAKSLGNY